MALPSVLFEQVTEGPRGERPEVPACFADLNLDQVVETITAGKHEYNLKPFFYASLRDVESIRYRQEVMQDLEDPSLFKSIEAFASAMRAMREHLAQADKLHYKYQKERWFLDAVDIYCQAVSALARDLPLLNAKSRGLRAMREYLSDYAGSSRFASLLAETKQLLADLASVQYCLVIKGNAVTVRKYEAETDYSAEVEATFEKFKQGAVKDYRVNFRNWPEMNHVEAQVLHLVAQLYPDVFARLDAYYADHRDYLDPATGTFDREVQFYVACLEYCGIFKRKGLKFCYPQVSDRSKEVHAYEAFDLALDYKLIVERSTVVCNDFYLKGKERILVVSGPNQGGKTTFARTFGQLHYLASLGCPVPGRQARLFLFDRLFTHFEREEDLQTLRGKLEDELVRLHQILAEATSSSIIIMNEIFTSATLQDAIFLGREVMETIIGLDLLGVCVTFIDELASMSDKTVSMVSTVVPDNPTLRTFKIMRRPADGLSYAISIAEKYGLTYDCLKERMQA